MGVQKIFLPIQDRHKIIYRLLGLEKSFPIRAEIYCRLLPCRRKSPCSESDHRKRWRAASHLSNWSSSFSPQGTSNDAMAHHDAWTASFPQPSPALGNTLFSLFLRLGKRSWFQQQENNQMTDSGPFPHNQNLSDFKLVLWPKRWVAIPPARRCFYRDALYSLFPRGMW